MAAHELVPGEPLTRERYEALSPELRAAATEGVARFLAQLHAAPLPAVGELAPLDAFRLQLAGIEERIFPLLSGAAVAACLELLQSARPDPRRALVHNDLSLGHIDRNARRCAGALPASAHVQHLGHAGLGAGPHSRRR
jgi:aminoglycoside phosphotransferase (APT) family kinase protein